MPLSGIHIACGHVGDSRGREGGVAIARKPAWSQTMASAGTTTQSAVGDTIEAGSVSFEVRSSVDAYVAIGKAPDASQANGAGDAARLFIAAGETRNVYCQAGDRLAWVAA